VKDGKKQVIIKVNNNKIGDKIIITNVNALPSSKAEWNDLTGGSYTAYLETGTYYIWVKNSYSNVVGPHVIDVYVDDEIADKVKKSGFDFKYLLYLMVVLIGGGLGYIFFKIKKGNNC